jgi:hypothetical protein
VARFAEIFNAQSLYSQSGTDSLNDMARAAGWTVLEPGESI